MDRGPTGSSGQRFAHSPPGHDRLKGKFADPKKSGLTAKVEAKSNDLPPFELKAEVLPQQQAVVTPKMRKKIRDGD